MEEQKINKKITFSIVAVLLIVLVTIGATYAYFSAQAQTEVQTVTTGTLTMGFEDGEIINATGIVPINDNEIETKATSLPFSITNTGNQHMNIIIKLTDITIDDALKDVDFRWGLYNPDKQDAKGTEMGIAFGVFKYSETGKEEIIYRDSIIDAGAPTKNYVLRIWIHDNNKVQNYLQGKSFSAKVTVTGEAIEYTPENCFTFNNKMITDYDVATCGTDVVIPRTIDSVNVTTLDDYSFENMGLTSVIIPDTVTDISYASVANNNLTHITIPESVINIDGQAFDNNKYLESVCFSENSVNLSAVWHFGGSNLKTVVIPGTWVLPINGEVLFYNSPNLTDIILMDEIETIGNLSDIIDEINIGDSINYVYLNDSEISRIYTTPSVGSGKEVADITKTYNSASDAKIEKWKVLSINDDNTIDLIAELPANNEYSLSLELIGLNGWINGTTVLNEICATLYSGKYGVARSINVEDIENATQENVQQMSLTEAKQKIASLSNNHIPATVNVDDLIFAPQTLKIYSSREEASGTSFLDAEKVLGNDNFKGSWWVADRGIGFGDNYLKFRQFHVQKSFTSTEPSVQVSLLSRHLYNYVEGTQTDGDFNFVVRPVVTLNANVTLTKVGDFSESNRTWEIRK